MADYRRHLDAFRQWLRQPPKNLTGKEHTIRWWIDLSRHCLAELQNDRANQMAAALTYHTMFSLMPTLVLALVVLQAFVDDSERDMFKHNVTNWILSPLQQEAPAFIDEDPATTDARRQEFDDVRNSLAERIETVMDRLEGVSFNRIGAVGVLIFLYGATGLLSTVERSFNTVYKAAHGRSFQIRLPIYYTVITVAPIVIVGGQVAQRAFINAIAGESWADWVLTLGAAIAPLLAAWIVLYLVFVMLPNTRVSRRMAIIGSFVSALLWILGLQLFSIYVQRAAVSTLYGALGLLPLFLFWMWLTWVIVLFGLEFTYALQAMREGRFRHGYNRERSQVVVDRTLLVPMATLIAQRFADGKLTQAALLSEKMGIPERGVKRLLAALVNADIVYYVKDRGREGYTLARPAAEITASQILAAGESLLPVPWEEPFGKAWDYVGKLQEKMRESTGDTNLADLSAASP